MAVKLRRPPEASVRVLPAAMVTVPTATLLVARLLIVRSFATEDAPVPSLMLSVACASPVIVVADA